MSFARWRHFIAAGGGDCGYPWAVLSLEQDLTCSFLRRLHVDVAGKSKRKKKSKLTPTVIMIIVGAVVTVVLGIILWYLSPCGSRAVE